MDDATRDADYVLRWTNAQGVAEELPLLGEVAIGRQPPTSPGATPLLCVNAVHKVASGDLSFPGKIMEQK